MNTTNGMNSGGTNAANQLDMDAQFRAGQNAIRAFDLTYAVEVDIINNNPETLKNEGEASLLIHYKGDIIKHRVDAPGMGKLGMIVYMGNLEGWEGRGSRMSQATNI